MADEMDDSKRALWGYFARPPRPGPPPFFSNFIPSLASLPPHLEPDEIPEIVLTPPYTSSIERHEVIFASENPLPAAGTPKPRFSSLPEELIERIGEHCIDTYSGKDETVCTTCDSYHDFLHRGGIMYHGPHDPFSFDPWCESCCNDHNDDKAVHDDHVPDYRGGGLRSLKNLNLASKTIHKVTRGTLFRRVALCEPGPSLVPLELEVVRMHCDDPWARARWRLLRALEGPYRIPVEMMEAGIESLHIELPPEDESQNMGNQFYQEFANLIVRIICETRKLEQLIITGDPGFSVKSYVVVAYLQKSFRDNRSNLPPIRRLVADPVWTFLLPILPNIQELANDRPNILPWLDRNSGILATDTRSYNRLINDFLPVAASLEHLTKLEIYSAWSRKLMQALNKNLPNLQCLAMLRDLRKREPGSEIHRGPREHAKTFMSDFYSDTWNEPLIFHPDLLQELSAFPKLETLVLPSVMSLDVFHTEPRGSEEAPYPPQLLLENNEGWRLLYDLEDDDETQDNEEDTKMRHIMNSAYGLVAQRIKAIAPSIRSIFFWKSFPFNTFRRKYCHEEVDLASRRDVEVTWAKDGTHKIERGISYKRVGSGNLPYGHGRVRRLKGDERLALLGIEFDYWARYNTDDARPQSRSRWPESLRPTVKTAPGHVNSSLLGVPVQGYGSSEENWDLDWECICHRCDKLQRHWAVFRPSPTECPGRGYRLAHLSAQTGGRICW